MQKALFCSFVIILLNRYQLIAHDGHHANQEVFTLWMQWIGRVHLIFLHFPIALVIMTAIADLLFYWKKKTIFNQASIFMLYAAAVWTIPTVLSGLSLGYGASYKGGLEDVYYWHRALGILFLIAIFCVLALRQLHSIFAYYIGIICLVILVTIIGMLGGGLAFGFETFFPP